MDGADQVPGSRPVGNPIYDRHEKTKPKATRSRSERQGDTDSGPPIFRGATDQLAAIPVGQSI